MIWKLDYLPEAKEDLRKLNDSDRRKVLKILERVSSNPLPVSEGGYGKPLGNHRGRNLSGLLKVKLKKEGIRVVYRLQRTENGMLVIVIGARADEEVYDDAWQRRRRHQL